MGSHAQGQTLFLKAQAARQAGRNAEAETLLRKAMWLDPARASIRINLAGALIDQGKHAEALPLCERLVREVPDLAVCWYRLALCQTAAARHQDALGSIGRFLAINPGNLEGLKRQFVLFMACRDAQGMLSVAQELVGKAPHEAGAYDCLATACEFLHDHAAELTWRRHACALAPDDANRLWNIALALLMVGLYAEAWPAYEARWHMCPPVASRYQGNAPRWDGSVSLKGRAVLVWAEQGLGDCLQFARYLPDLLRMGGKIVLQVDASLAALLHETLGIPVCCPGSVTPPHDLHVPLLSLPACLLPVPDLPPPLPLHVPEAQEQEWAKRLGTRLRPRVGLMWCGNVTSITYRNLPLQALAELFDLPADFHCVSNCVEPEERLQAQYNGWNVVFHDQEIHSFADTAALLREMDILVTIDTSVAHLGPSLGVPTWVLLPWEADWRWGNTEASPWYPQSRLFRQSQWGEWENPVHALCHALADQIRVESRGAMA